MLMEIERSMGLERGTKGIGIESDKKEGRKIVKNVTGGGNERLEQVVERDVSRYHGEVEGKSRERKNRKREGVTRRKKEGE